jgi:hypothetical protein
VLVNLALVEEDEGGEEVEDEDGEVAEVGGTVGLGVGDIEGAPVALVMLVASTFVVAGAAMVGGKAEANALEPGVN